MIKYYCDRCKKDCSVFFYVNAYGNNDDELGIDFYKYMLCTDCFNKIKNWIETDEQIYY